MTYVEILQRMLNKVPGDVDKREGSIIYTALAPAAFELAQMYIELEYLDSISYADKATDNYLTLRCEERGINRKKATKAIRKGEFNINIPTLTKFGIDNLIYTVIEKIGNNNYKLECETPGEVGNNSSGILLPLDYIEGLNNSVLTDIIIPGEDEETDERLRSRYFESLESEAFGGNIADYKKKTKDLNGVGGVKVYTVWNGGGTVKLVIMDSTFNKPSSVLINEIQSAIDPLQNQGKGVGLAPIGHVVTVVGVEETIINIESSITLQSNYRWEDVLPYIKKAVSAYFEDVKKTWDSENNLVIRIAHIETSILGITGVLDIQNTKLNNQTQNILVSDDSIPKLGVITNV
ncbi:baseplate J/gp47 family protein [Vallitalea sp.]|jgi:uncharacterized phage protein gp47/JayE|uniref:baseplate J/gp47 family protein n=1 Tax=Vallitalea sp. TaxID=1882829 RepID=UPI0025E546D0|nr:baseplate J/gp47 family protein [Vallitalea sp.]MCT4686091.1 baseplate J/gp47 family protein [Vallitalea sp.]